MIKNEEKVKLTEKVNIEKLVDLSQILSRQDNEISQIDAYYDKKREEIKKQKEEIVKHLDDYSELLWNEQERQIDEEKKSQKNILASIYEKIKEVASVINISNEDLAALLSEKTGKKWILVAGKSKDKDYQNQECQAWLYAFSEEDENFDKVKNCMVLNKKSWGLFNESESCINFYSSVSTPGKWVNERFLNLLETNWVKPYLAYKYTIGNFYVDKNWEVDLGHMKPKDMKDLVFETLDEYVTKLLQQSIEDNGENE